MSKRRKVLVIGSSSLVGSHFVENYGDRYEISAIGRKNIFSNTNLLSSFETVDILDGEKLAEAIRSSDAEFVINYAAETNVDRCEAEKGNESGRVYLTNVEAVHVMATACKDSRKRLVQISTDFVFDGTCGPYSEDDLACSIHSKIGWYGYTKYLAETKIHEVAVPGSAIIRISYPYRARYESKTDFARNIIDLYQKGKLYPMFDDQIFSPTLINDVSSAIDFLMEHSLSGTYHVASRFPSTPFEFASKLISTFFPEDSPPSIKKGSILEFNKIPGRAPRPVRGGLRTDKIGKLGFIPKTIEESIQAIFVEQSNL
jgi:dTDP-4-dehydrorhamnose reductase